MLLSAKSLALTLAVLWGGAMLIIGVLNRFFLGYGGQFLIMIRSVYPAPVEFGSSEYILVGVIYGVVDGALAGLLIATVYNFFLKRVGS